MLGAPPVIYCVVDGVPAIEKKFPEGGVVTEPPCVFDTAGLAALTASSSNVVFAIVVLISFPSHAYIAQDKISLIVTCSTNVSEKGLKYGN
jgi:hypothetical protein